MVNNVIYTPQGAIMPIVHGKSKEAFKKNVKREVKEGKPKAQSLAIAYAEKRDAEKRDRKERKK